MINLKVIAILMGLEATVDQVPSRNRSQFRNILETRTILSKKMI